MSDKKIQWHPGFAAAMDLELSANRSKGFIDIIKSEVFCGRDKSVRSQIIYRGD